MQVQARHQKSIHSEPENRDYPIMPHSPQVNNFGKSTTVRVDIKNANSAKTLLTQNGNNHSIAVLREKSNLVRNDRPSRGHRSLGDLHELINKYKPKEKKNLTRKSDGKEYKIVRREYIY